MKYKQKRKLIELNCDFCNKKFKKPIPEFTRNKEKGCQNFCSRECAGKNIGLKYCGKVKYDITQHSNNKLSEYTPFKYYLKLVRQRFKESNVTLEILNQQWKKQKGICPYSGIALELSTHSKIIKDPIVCASLDRIDSSIGYIEGNIQFVSRSINYMKGEMSHEDTIKLCKIIANFYNKL